MKLGKLLKIYLSSLISRVSLYIIFWKLNLNNHKRMITYKINNQSVLQTKTDAKFLKLPLISEFKTLQRLDNQVVMDISIIPFEVKVLSWAWCKEQLSILTEIAIFNNWFRCQTFPHLIQGIRFCSWKVRHLNSALKQDD